MEIKIYKNEKDKICFKLNEVEYEFKYESFDTLIETFYNNDVEIKYQVDEDLDEYKKLIEGIINGSRTEDYRTAVLEATRAKEALEKVDNVE